MKDGIHPNYQPTTIRCACGAVYETRSTKQNISIEICSKCHPFYTGTQKLDTSGRLDKFNKKYGITYDRTRSLRKAARVQCTRAFSCPAAFVTSQSLAEFASADAKKFQSFSPAACTAEKIPLGSQTCALGAFGVQCVRCSELRSLPQRAQRSGPLWSVCLWHTQKPRCRSSGVSIYAICAKLRRCACHAPENRSACSGRDAAHSR